MYFLIFDVVVPDLQIEIEFPYLLVLLFKLRLRVGNLSYLQEYLIDSLWAERGQDTRIELIDSPLHELALLLEKEVRVHDLSFFL